MKDFNPRKIFLQRQGNSTHQETIVFNRNHLIIGNDEKSADIVHMKSRLVSMPRHCELTIRDGKLFVNPFKDSKTFVNIKKITCETVLKPGDLIGFGQSPKSVDLTDKRMYVYLVKVNQEKISEAAEIIAENQINEIPAPENPDSTVNIEILNANATEVVPTQRIIVFEDPVQRPLQPIRQVLKGKPKSRLPVRTKHQITIPPQPPTVAQNDKENRLSGTVSCLKIVPQPPKKYRTRRSGPEKTVVFNQERNQTKLFTPDGRSSPYIDPRSKREPKRSLRSSMAKAREDLKITPSKNFRV